MGEPLRIKKIFTKPKAGSLPSGPSERQPEIEIIASRHDDHNVEIKTVLDATECRAAGQVDIYFFIPSSMHVEDKAQIMSDFYSRVRLSIPNESIKDQSLILQKIHALKARVSAISDNPSVLAHFYEQTNDVVFASARHLGAVFGEIYKNKSLHIKKELLLIHSLANPPTDPKGQLAHLCQPLGEVCKLQAKLREAMNAPGAENYSILNLLDRYVHNVYVDFLAGIKLHFDQMKHNRASDSALFEEGWENFSQRLDQKLNEEADYAFKKFNYNDIHTDEMERERHILQQNQLKKFFQSEMFVDVNKAQSIKKFSEPAAAVAAGIAATWAALFERASNPNLVDIGFRGLFLMCLGIALYVLKDRLKDHGRAFFTRKISKWLPDVEQELKTEDKKIGTVREWYSLRKKSDLPPEVRDLRESAYMSSAEAHLSEDVIQNRREFEVGTAGRAIACHDILRVNLQRYLKHMDDPMKDMKFLDERGKVTVLKSHRVYHFYLAIVARNGDPKELSHEKVRRASDLRQLHRIVMDKGGIVRLEKMA